ncbi:MAG: four helix bundle protein, partial [Bacteroidales bacterium]|nr:four helix bundle protein [Bacteroidales bacterium]
ETEYWLELLYKTEYINEKENESINNDCIEIKKILHAIVKTTKSTLNS